MDAIKDKLIPDLEAGKKCRIFVLPIVGPVNDEDFEKDYKEVVIPHFMQEAVRAGYDYLAIRCEQEGISERVDNIIESLEDPPIPVFMSTRGDGEEGEDG